MAKYDNIKSLLASIISKNYDSIGMCYYPVSDQNVTSYGNNTITKINRDPSVLIRGTKPPVLGPGETNALK